MYSLDERWRQFWNERSANPYEVVRAFARLAQSYSGSNRLYHNLAHIAHCLGTYDQFARLAYDPSAVELALWYHDIVYDAGATNNEERSTDYAIRDLQKLDQPAAIGSRVNRLILATKHNTLLEDHDSQLVADIDLSSLGSSLKEFRLHRESIRNEYAHVPDAEFNKGRARILQGFLDRPNIYYFTEFREVFETPARKNLEYAIALLDEQARAL